MIKLISSKAACFLCKENDEETLELYEYAIYIILSAFLHIVTIVILGLCFNLLMESIVFYSSFILIRKFAGGYHAKTLTRCYLFSVFLSIIMLYLIKFISNFNSKFLFVFIMIELLCVVLISIISPLDTDNNPLNSCEKKIYGKISSFIAIFIFILSILFMFIDFRNIGISMLCGTILSTVVLLMRKAQKIHHRRNIDM